MAGRPSKPGTVSESRSTGEESAAEGTSALPAGALSRRSLSRLPQQGTETGEEHTGQHRDAHHGADAWPRARSARRRCGTASPYLKPRFGGFYAKHTFT